MLKLYFIFYKKLSCQKLYTSLRCCSIICTYKVCAFSMMLLWTVENQKVENDSG
jgi:hypothetical protein